MLLTSINHFRTLIDRYQKPFIFTVSADWLSLFSPIWSILGQAQGSVNIALTLYIFPMLGILSLLVALVGRKIGLFLFSLLLVFAFPVTMVIGYALLGA